MFFRVFRNRSETGPFSRYFPLVGKVFFVKPLGSSECTSPEVSVTAPKVVGRAQLISVRSIQDIVSATEGKKQRVVSR